MNEKSIFFLILVLLIASTFSFLHGVTTKEWKGKLNGDGYIKIDEPLEEKTPFQITGRVFYKNLWRPVPIFWNKESIIIDIGPEFKDIPYYIIMIRYQS